MPNQEPKPLRSKAGRKPKPTTARRAEIVAGYAKPPKPSKSKKALEKKEELVKVLTQDPLTKMSVTPAKMPRDSYGMNTLGEDLSRNYSYTERSRFEVKGPPPRG